MKEGSEWQSNSNTHSTCLSFLWKKLPSRNQVMGGVAIGGGMGCQLLRLLYNFSVYDQLGALLIILGIIKFQEEPQPLPRHR